jgi:CMP-N-acetylneuraminic acid synthetase
MKTISAVINARLQSTRVPKKLIRKFGHTSLIEIALEKLNKMEFFDARFLAVADKELEKIGANYQYVNILRRKKESVLKGVNPQKITFAHYKEIPSEYIFVFNPCLPMIRIETIKMAYDYFQKHNFPSYTSVVPTGDWVFDSLGNAVTNTNPTNLTTNKDVQFYKAAHAFHIIKKSIFVEKGYHWTFNQNDPHMINISTDEHIDVDTMIDFQFAEFMYSSKK